MYPKCGEEEETAYHFLGKCNATITARHFILVLILSRLVNYNKCNRALFEVCYSLKEIYITIWLSRDCALGRN